MRVCPNSVAALGTVANHAATIPTSSHSTAAFSSPPKPATSNTIAAACSIIAESTTTYAN